MASSTSPRTQVFICYSHANKKWLKLLERHLKPLARSGSLDFWNDTHIKAGDDWKKEIQSALDSARVAVLLISADFFASDYIDASELPPLLTAAEGDGVIILPVILSASRFERVPGLNRFQAVNPPNKPLGDMSENDQDHVLDSLAKRIEGIFNHP